MEDWTFEGTSRINRTGSSGTGTATVPKHLSDYLIDEHGKDLAVFSQGDKLMLVPRGEVSVNE